MQRDIVWWWSDRPGLEHLRLVVGAEEVVADGQVVVDLGAGIVRLAYTVHCDQDWQVRRARLAIEHGKTQRSLVLEREAEGRWRVDGATRPDLAQCRDIDIMASPFTNTLPIRRLAFAPNEVKRLVMAYIRVPELTVSAASQEYTRLDGATPPRRFRYHGVGTDFTAELTVDEDGIVVEYPPYWQRRV